jgi:glycosyltransferase involved in cell wall biosynthesis
MRKNISRKGIPKEKMTAVPMAVSIKDIPDFGHKIDGLSNNREKIVVYLGTLVKMRKMDFLLRSFERVLRKEKNARLYLVGGSEDPADEKFLENEAKRLQTDHAVTITGFLPQKKAWQYAKDADVCVSPIYPVPILNCGSPTKLIEYMAMGKAVVANDDNPEQRVVISESKAGICVPYEEAAFAEAILYLLKNQDIAKQMGIRGRKYIEKKRNYGQAADLVETKLLEIAKIPLHTPLKGL